MFYVYVLRSKKDGSTYIGQTSNLEKRLEDHNAGLSGYTRNHTPYALVYMETYETRGEAMRREKYLKSLSGYHWLKQHVFSHPTG
jgi:putative endonuclease